METETHDLCLYWGSLNKCSDPKTNRFTHIKANLRILYYIPSSCESEMPVPVTFVSILFSASYLVLEFQSAGTGVSFS